METRDVRANQWEYVDYNGDDIKDLIIGIDDWGDNRDGIYDSTGQWKGGPLHGFVYLLLNNGTNEKPVYAQPKKVSTTDGITIDVYGWPSPVFADFTGSGKLDLICGEFRDGFTYYKNVGTRETPLYAPGRSLTYKDKRLTMDLCMSVPVAIDFTKDGYMDLIVGEEGGRVALMEHTGKVVDGMPQFKPPVFFQQEADEVKFGALSTPVGFDWDGDGREDILAGNSEGQIAFIKNLGGRPATWASPQLLEADGNIIHIQAGVNGSVQGPTETKWGYTSLSVADWNHDGVPDLIVNSILGKVIWYENTGNRKNPKLKAAKPIEVMWPGDTPKPFWNWWTPTGKELVTQWRTNPVAIDWTRDGLTDLVMLDHEGYLALFRREKRGDTLVLLPGERIFRMEGVGNPLRLNEKNGGGSGRRQLSITDLDGDGRLDLIVDSENATIYKNIGEEKE
ncbi:MAG: VCBS repeat-containing protein [Bacteroidota bacterium]